MYENARKLAIDEVPHAQCVGLPEALKIRVITKGPPITYFVLKPLQKFLWSSLRKRPEFPLIGEPLTADLLNQRFSRLRPETMFLSGDYTAATDELQSFVSNSIVDGISAALNLPEDMRVLFKRALTGHIFVDGEGNEAPQKRGQLMGSIVSFPILCVANYCLIRMAQIWSNDHGPFLINGDDCLIGHLGHFPHFWRKIGTAMGLSESIGKTYNSDSFCTLNSLYFKMNKGKWVSMKHVNMGHLLAKKSGGDKETKGNHELGVLHQELIAKSPEKMKGLLHDYFIYLHSNKLKDFRGSWFLPTYLGGLGLLPKGGDWSRYEKCKAAGLKKLMSDGARIPTIPTEKTWFTHDEIQQKLKQNVPGYEIFGAERLQEEVGEAILINWMLFNTSVEFLCMPDIKFHQALRKWKRDCSRLYQRALVTVGKDKHVRTEVKSDVMLLGVYNSS
jgi:hypothetical protein